MMQRRMTRVNPSEEPIKIGPIGIRFLLTRDDSNGSASVFEVYVPAGQKPPAPAHKNDACEEVLYGVQGVLTWTVDGTPIAVGPGQALCIPRGAAHRFDNLGSGDVKQLCVITHAIMGPAYFREAADASSLSCKNSACPGFKIPHFLRDPHTGAFRDPKQYPSISLATAGTHDHEPLAAQWRNLWRRVDAGQHGDDGQRWEGHQAQLELGQFMRLAGLGDEPPPREFTSRVHEGSLRGILESNSWLAIFTITDVFARDIRFNVPGALADSNWTARVEHTVTGLERDPVIKTKADLLTRLIKATNRNG